MSQSNPTSRPDSPSTSGAAVVTDDSSYPMFELRELRGDGALLSGPLLLEVSEELTLRLQPASGAPLVLRARVTAVENAGLAVSFVDLSPAERQRLQALRP
jgi:PilZ domain-containing protein